MSAPTGVPTYTSAPLNPNQKDEGTHGSTSDPEPATSIEASTTEAKQPQTTSATATAPSYSPIYATAQAGDPLPQPGATPSLATATAAPVPQHGHLAPTPTSTLPTATSYTPPAPQPGATPVAAGAGGPPLSTSPVPPPPKAGEPVAVSSNSAALPTQSPFTQSYSYQRTSHSQPPIPNSTTTPYSSAYPNSPGAGGSRPHTLPLYGGSGSGGGANNIFGEDEEPGFLSTAKTWMQSAGTKLAEVEAEVWKRINDAHGK